MASSNFHVGQKVVCISSSDTSPRGIVPLSKIDVPEVGSIYTVRRMFESDETGNILIEVSEIETQVVPILVRGDFTFGIVGFEHQSFRPVVERKTDISIFQAMLNKTPAQVPA